MLAVVDVLHLAATTLVEGARNKERLILLSAVGQCGSELIHEHIGLADAGRIADLLHAEIGDVGARNDAVAPP